MRGECPVTEEAAVEALPAAVNQGFPANHQKLGGKEGFVPEMTSAVPSAENILPCP